MRIALEVKVLDDEGKEYLSRRTFNIFHIGWTEWIDPNNVDKGTFIEYPVGSNEVLICPEPEDVIEMKIAQKMAESEAAVLLAITERQKRTNKSKAKR